MHQAHRQLILEHEIDPFGHASFKAIPIHRHTGLIPARGRQGIFRQHFRRGRDGKPGDERLDKANLLG